MADSNKMFSSRLGLLAATIGSAVGLGTIWRFPSEVQQNGGAAFLLLYLACVLILGIPVMLAEMSVGRGGRGDAVSSFTRITPGTRWGLFGGLGIVASYLIMCFYMVVAGWTLQYLFQSCTGDLYQPIAGITEPDALFTAKMQQYIYEPWPAMTATWAVLAINVVILMGGVQKGIERMANVMMPILFLVLVILAGVSLSLPGASRGVDWFLRPDFSVITFATVFDALGQAFFSLSLGMAIIITYSSYYPKDTPLVRTAACVSASGIVVALLVGLVVFPAVVSFGLADHGLDGVTLVFQTLPEVFVQMAGTQFWSIIFFLLLFTAAITSTVSSAETCIAWLQDRWRMSRRGAVLLTLVPLAAFSAVCALSFNVLSGIKIGGLIIFDFLDTLSCNVLLPVAALGVCVYVGWVAPRDLLRRQLTNDGTLAPTPWRRTVTAMVGFIIRYIAPALIAAILIANLV